MFLALLLVILATTLIEASFPPNQWNALYDLYNSTQGWNWQYPSDVGVWDFSNSSVNPCIAGWQGILCSFNNQTFEYTVWYLDLGNYGLNGFIPDTINQLSNLTVLDLANNNLFGTIPETLYNLSQLLALELYYNKLNGTISSSISSLKNLTAFLIDYNQLTGSIPDELFSLPLVVINLSYNKLSGKLPKTVGNCSKTLLSLEISNNQFHSSLPDSLYDLQTLNYLIINSNEFSGTISEKLANMQNLIGVTGEENNFFGSLPSNIFTRNTTYIELAVNLLSGTLPPCTAQIMDLSLQVNSFFGTIPESLWQISNLNGVILGNNFFNGTVTFKSSQLTGAALNHNLLSGTLPIPVSTLMAVYSLRSNFFTGTVSSNLWSSCDYAEVDVSQNYLHGSFTQSNITDMIQSLNISYNLFSGSFTLPTPFSWLNSLSISNNFFTGSFITDRNSFWNLKDLDISSNQFTGDLPASLPLSLQVFSASTNCFRGLFPEEWCGLGNMTNWILNGLSSSSYCQKALFPGTSIKTFVTKYGTTNALPVCLLGLASLELFLSGNELTGSLPDGSSNSNSSEMAGSLLYLDLSHNRLTGTIPMKFQERVWSQLDLSFNLLGGTLSSSMYSFGVRGSSLKLDRNRLSGSVPSSLLEAESINILDGNLFSCNFDSSALPEHDPSGDNYSCGSDTTNAAIYLWLGLMFVLCVLSGLGLWLVENGKGNKRKDKDEKENEISLVSFVLVRYQTFHAYCVDAVEGVSVSVGEVGSVERRRNSNSIRLLRIYNEKMRQTALLIGGFSVTVFIPLLSMLSLFYSVYSERYSWVLSGLFLEGEGSALGLFVGYLVFVSFVWYVLNGIWFSIEKDKETQRGGPERNSLRFEDEAGTAEVSITSRLGEERHQLSGEDKKTRVMIYALAGAINLTVMLLVDFLYVYIVISYDTTIITIAVMMLALGKIIWNSYLMWNGLRWCRRIVLVLLGRSEVEGKNLAQVNEKRFTKADIAFVSLSLGLNNLIYPAIALLVLSTNCYQSALFQAPEISSFYQYNVSRVTVTQASAVSTVTSEYLPPFTYSYQCASVVYAYYCPLFIFTFIFEGLLFPAIELLRSFRVSILTAEKKGDSEVKSVEMVSADVVPAILDNGDADLPIGDSLLLPITKLLTFFSDANDTSHSILFHKHRYVVRFNSYLLTMVIYGAVFPPVALIGLVSIVTRTWFEEVMFGHLLDLSKKREHLKDEIERKLSTDCGELLESMDSLLYIVLPIPMLIYSYLVFDTFGQDTSVAIGLIPGELLLVLYVMIVVVHRYSRFGLLRKAGEPAGVEEGEKETSEKYEVKNPII